VLLCRDQPIPLRATDQKIFAVLDDRPPGVIRPKDAVRAQGRCPCLRLRQVVRALGDLVNPKPVVDSDYQLRAARAEVPPGALIHNFNTTTWYIYIWAILIHGSPTGPPEATP
jgi:hypothetical protein